MNEDARKIWRQKLAFLQEEEAKLSDPTQRFNLAMLIQEIEDKLAEMDGGVPDGLDYFMNEDARKIWRQKLAFFQEEEAKLSDPTQRFNLAMLIREIEDKLAEMDGRVPDSHDHRPTTVVVDMPQADREPPPRPKAILTFLEDWSEDFELLFDAEQKTIKDFKVKHRDHLRDNMTRRNNMARENAMRIWLPLQEIFWAETTFITDVQEYVRKRYEVGSGIDPAEFNVLMLLGEADIEPRVAKIAAVNPRLGPKLWEPSYSLLKVLRAVCKKHEKFRSALNSAVPSLGVPVRDYVQCCAKSLNESLRSLETEVRALDDQLRVRDEDSESDKPHPAETITRRQSGPSVRTDLDTDSTTGPKSGARPEVCKLQPLHILSICTEWFSRHGGLSTFNRNLCIALHDAGHQVVCLVADKNQEEDKDADRQGVKLIAAPAMTDTDEKSRLFLRANMPAGFLPQVIIGHDHVSGTAAKVQAEYWFRNAARVHFIHTAPGDIELFKSPAPGTTAAAKGESKEKRQLELAAKARLVVAVGPRLHAEIGTQLYSLHPNRPYLYRLDPGILAPSIQREPPPLSWCLLLGRTEDRELKGLDIAARALGLMTGERPRLIVRGAEPGKGDELRAWLLKCGRNPGLKIHTKEYVADDDTLAADFLRSSLVLMPSRSEGFGLVGIEALAIGTPILISDQSGLAELIKEHCSLADASRCIVQVTGDREADAVAWERQIDFVMRDRRAAFLNAEAMAQTLSQKVTWHRAVCGLLDALTAARDTSVNRNV